MLKTGTIVDATIIAQHQEMQRSKTKWHVAMRPGKRKALDPERELHKLLDKAVRLKDSVRAKVEHSANGVLQTFPNSGH